MNRSTLLSVLALLLYTSPTYAAKKVSKVSVEIDGRSYIVIWYADDTAKVVEAGIFGKAPGKSLRAAMTRAVKEATGCSLTDDFFVDAKLSGSLACSRMPFQAGGR